MGLYPFERFKSMHPNWCLLDEVELVPLDAGEGIPPHRSDANQLYLILEGQVETIEGSDRMVAEPGEALLVKAGVVHGLPRAIEPTVLIRISDIPHVPFREQRQDMAMDCPVLLPPVQPLPSPRRLGVAVDFDESQTFNPRLLAAERGGDLLLGVNPGALARSQIKELRNHCVETSRALIGITIPGIEQREIPTFLKDPTLGGVLFDLHPLSISISADPATPEGRLLGNELVRHWGPRLHVEGIKPCLLVEQREWSDEELRDIFGWLMTIPPAKLGIHLRWVPERFKGDFRSRRALEALLPWVVAVKFVGRDGHSQVDHYLQGLGFQGWVVQKLPVGSSF